MEARTEVLNENDGEWKIPSCAYRQRAYNFWWSRVVQTAMRAWWWWPFVVRDAESHLALFTTTAAGGVGKIAVTH